MEEERDAGHVGADVSGAFGSAERGGAQRGAEIERECCVMGERALE